MAKVNPNQKKKQSIVETRRKIRATANDTSRKIRELSNKMSVLSDKINSIPDGFGLVPPEKVDSYHPSGRGGAHLYHPSEDYQASIPEDMQGYQPSNQMQEPAPSKYPPRLK